MKEKFKAIEKVFLIFIIGSICGYIFETIVVLFQKGHFEIRQGVIYGPFIPVYGLGGIMYYIFFEKVQVRKLPQVFLISMLLGGVTEYLCSWVQEMWFGTISWDYSYLPFNLNGRTSLLHCTYWGIAGILYIKFILPLIEKLDTKLEMKIVQSFTIILMIFMTYDLTISALAADRQSERIENIPPSNKLEKYLNKRYPDEYMDKIFNNRKYV